MRRVIPVTFLTFTLLLCFLAAPVLASTDDDVPGTSLAIGGSVSQSVNAGDPNDVYSVSLIAGQEVYIRCDPGNSYTGEGVIHLLVPAASTIAEPEGCDEISFSPVMGGIPYQTKHGGYFHYIPASSGTYYLWVEWTGGTLNYTLSIERETRTLTLAPDSDDVPGTAIGPGTVIGVVSTLADLNDVYAVALTAGKAVTVTLTPLKTLDPHFASTARVSLLGPSTTSVDETSGRMVVGPREANNAAADPVTIQYTPTQSGTYYVWVEAGPFGSSTEGMNFAYSLAVSVDGTAPGGSGFSDVPAGHAYATAITELASRGIILGFDGGTFRPNTSVTRQQFAKMIVGTLGISPNVSNQTRFIDLGTPDANGYPHRFVQTAYDYGITNGTNTAQTKFAPADSIRRDQVVSMIVRGVNSVSPGTLENPPAGAASPFAAVGDPHGANLRIAEYNHLLDDLIGMGSGWKVTANATRGECAQILYNLLQRQ